MLRIAGLAVFAALASATAGSTELTRPLPEDPYPDYSLDDAIDARIVITDPEASGIERVEARRILREFCASLPTRPEGTMERELQKWACD